VGFGSFPRIIQSVYFRNYYVILCSFLSFIEYYPTALVKWPNTLLNQTEKKEIFFLKESLSALAGMANYHTSRLILLTYSQYSVLYSETYAIPRTVSILTTIITLLIYFGLGVSHKLQTHNFV
jgi:hypothetical protein